MMLFCGGVWADDYQTHPKDDTAARGIRAAQYLNDAEPGAIKLVLAMGGYFEPNQGVTGARIIKSVVSKNLKGIDVPWILEEGSRDTFENIELGLPMVRKAHPGGFRLLLVSHPAHLRRIRITLAARGVDLRLVNDLPVNYQLTLKEQFWEVAFWLVHRVWPTTGGPLGRRNRKKRTYNR